MATLVIKMSDLSQYLLDGGKLTAVTEPKGARLEVLRVDDATFANLSAAYAAPPPTYKDSVLALSPLGYWALDEASGAAVDASTHGHNGTYLNTPGRAAAAISPGLGASTQFIHGTNTYVDITGISLAGLGASGYSFSAWVWIDDVANQMGISATDYVSGRDLWEIALSSSGHWSGTLYNASTTPVISSAVATTGAHHVVFNVSSSGVLELFIDGASVGTGSTGALTSIVNTEIIIGMPGPFTGSFTWHGRISDVALLGAPLSSVEVAALYALGL